MIEEAIRDPISVSMLKINGGELIKHLGIDPGPKVGAILHALLEEVLEDPKLNKKEYLEKRSAELNSMDEKELETLGKKGKKKEKEANKEKVDEIRGKFHVK
jgi:RecB family exonuclease